MENASLIFDKAQQKKYLEDDKILDQYKIGPYTILIVDYFSFTNEPLYATYSILESPFLQKLFDELILQFELKIDIDRLPEETKFLSLDDLLRKRQETFLDLIAQKYPKIEDVVDPKNFAKICCFETIGLSKIAPLLLDSMVEEFFLDSLHSNIYLDHRVWGRCRTKINLTQEEISRLVTRIRCEGRNLSFDENNPSIKVEMITSDFHLRAAADIPPLSADGFHLNIRKLRKIPFTIPELIANSTLTSEISAFLYFCFLRRRNIVVMGEPGTGKTTLVNALDLLSPPEWRKVTIEDTIESVEQSQYNKHQVRFTVDPIEKSNGSRFKSLEIMKLLHRNPDYIFLGEIQTPEHSRAMFHAISAGLRAIQTCHAYSPEDLVMKWVNHHNISVSDIFRIDLILFMRRFNFKGRIIRRLFRICEIGNPLKIFQNKIQIDLGVSKIDLVDLYNLFQNQKEIIQNPIDFFNASIITEITKLEALSKESFRSEIEFYSKIFSTLAEKRIFCPLKNSEIFHLLHYERIKQQQFSDFVNWDDLFSIILEQIRQIEMESVE